MQRNWSYINCKKGSLSITEIAWREDHLLTHIVRRELQMSWDIGGPISKSWRSDDRLFISSKRTTTQEATCTAFHPTPNTQRIHQSHPHFRNAILPPLKIGFLVENLWSRPSRAHVVTNTDATQGVWQSGRAEVTQGMTREYVRGPVWPWGPGGSTQDTQLRAPECPPLFWLQLRPAGQASWGLSTQGKKNNIGNFCSECHAERRQTPIRLGPCKSKSDRSPEMLPLLLFGIWQFYCFCCWWVVLVGNSLLWHVGYMHIFCNPLAIKLLHFYAELLGLSRIRHCICLPFQFSWSSAFSHKPTFPLILGYICISACKKTKNYLASGHTLPTKQNSAISLNTVSKWNEFMSEKAKHHILCIKRIHI